MSRSGKSIGLIVVIFLPVIVFLAYAFMNSGTLFRADDFHLLKTVLWMQDVKGPVEKFKLLIQQHNEHRIILPRLLTWLDYTVEGSINWRTLILIGNLLWVSVLYFFWKALKSKGLPAWMFIPVPYILFQPQYFDNVNWAISILQQSVIVFWFGLLCLLISQKRYGLAMLVALLATFTHGNGIFSFLIGVIICALERDWKAAAKWFAALIIMAVVYFWGFQKGQNADIQNSLSDPVRLIGGFFAFFGSMSTILFRSSNYAIILGAVFVVVLGVYLMPKIISLLRGRSALSFFDKMLLGNVIFLGITAALVSVSRSWSGIEAILASRYQHYAPFVACWVYLVAIVTATGNVRKFLAGGFIVFGIFFNAFSYFVYNEEVVFRRNWLVADSDNWMNHSVLLNDAKSFNDNIREPYNRAVSSGICKAYPSMLTIDTARVFYNNKFDMSTSQTVVEDRDASGVFQRGYLEIRNQTLLGTTYVYLQAKGKKGYWLPTHIDRTSIWKFLKDHNSTRPGFSVGVLTENFDTGTYRVGVLNKGTFTWTGASIDIVN